MSGSALSGLVWGAIGVLMLWITAPRFARIGEVAWDLRGGIVAAPLIGMAIGMCWRMFSPSGFGIRVTIAIVTLYLGAFAFTVAAALTSVASGVPPHMSLSMLIFNSFFTAFAGLTWTGFIVILGPLAFLNHLWIARCGETRFGFHGAVPHS